LQKEGKYSFRDDISLYEDFLYFPSHLISFINDLVNDPYITHETVHQSSKRIVLLLFVGVFLGICFVSGSKLMDTFREYKVFRSQEASNESLLAVSKMELKKRERYIEQLENDPELFEHIARQRLQYSKSGEIVFHFKDKNN
tara:strand:+ start:312 stop:737 length:426 start_codon:yes stop_codon:yes gene_type:complete